MAFAIIKWYDGKNGRCRADRSPKSLRDRLHLTAGSELALTQKDGQIVMSPIEPKSRLMRKEGLWVITGLPRRDINWNRLIEEDREERTRHLAGEK